MAARPFNLNRAKVTGPDLDVGSVYVTVRNGTARLTPRTAGQATVEKAGAADITAGGPGWLLTFDDGTVWEIARDGDCGCGGRRK